MDIEAVKVSVIICAYTQDRWIELQQAIQSVQAQTMPPSEIILVIDHNPALFALAHDIFSNVKVVENREELGLSGARNTGVALSTGQVIAFIDEDAQAQPDWVEKLLLGYENSQVIGVGGEVRPDWSVPAPDWFPEEYNWVVGCSYKGLPELRAAVRNPIGCNMSFKREALLYAKGFRSGVGRVGTLPVGCEETELTIRARQLNPNSIYLYEPTAVVYHKVPKWRLSGRYFIHRCYSEGLSKALVTHYVGSNDGLSSERNYVLNTLPKGVLSGLADSFTQHRVSGLKRSIAIVIGLFFTTAGYLAGSMKRFRTQPGEEVKPHNISSQARES
jgi:glycosyltransferase involved in cell wall biosynthesis